MQRVLLIGSSIYAGAKSNATGFHEAVKGQYEYYSKPARCPSLTEPLQKAGCTEFAVAVKSALQRIAQHE